MKKSAGGLLFVFILLPILNGCAAPFQLLETGTKTFLNAATGVVETTGKVAVDGAKYAGEAFTNFTGNSPEPEEPPLEP